MGKKIKYIKFLVCLFFVLFLCFDYEISFSQLSKRTWFIEGAGTYYGYKENYSTPTFSQVAKFTSIDFSPSVGYFILDKFVVGLKPTFSSYKGRIIESTMGSGGSTNSYSLTIGPYLRYYFLKIDKPFNIFGDASFQLGTYNRFGGINAKGNVNTYSVLCGSEIFFNGTAGVEFLLGYMKKNVSVKNPLDPFENQKRGVYLALGLTIHLENNNQ